jgi:hypothetical protein
MSETRPVAPGRIRPGLKISIRRPIIPARMSRKATFGLTMIWSASY